ncbi:CBS domain-containing protein [Haloferax elongans ATCC BAA-1513]|uniref:CBS domain-containing protein n=1 Tax=Haloferax elongans ATCC BAA-1513 TaxID=1230453 RepID=M0HST4_HALEO|nr:CBS domain-containing protein [Haloferax elongans]ELZ87655.1 CBS domain-containing protein [Haloferax elongans ATCC BAA-1513]
MDISNIVTDEFPTVGPDARVSELQGVFHETGTKAIVVAADDGYHGLVTLRQLNAAHRDPDAKARSILWHPATVAPDENVRQVARLILASQSEVLPVFEADDLVGIVSADDVLAEVQEYLSVLTVEDVYTDSLVTIDEDTTFGEALHTFRKNRITHLPVTDGDTVVGVVSLYDVLGFTTRAVDKASGGASSGFDVAAGEAAPGFRSPGGMGERAGEIDRLLDLPVADVMSAPIETALPEEGLDHAVERMLTEGVSSLIVIQEDAPAGIVTKTDVLRSLTWTGETRPPVQITNVDLLDDISRDEVVEMIDGLTGKFGGITLLEANIHLQEHDEKLRGTPLILARVRLYTDKGHFLGTGEGYGASHALHLARNVVERQLLEGKTHVETKKPPSDPEEYWSKVFGWWLTAPPRRR